MRLADEARRQVDSLRRHYRSWQRPEALKNLARSLQEAGGIIAQGRTIPSQQPYPWLARPGRAWVKSGRYWIAYTPSEPSLILAVFFDGADIPGRDDVPEPEIVTVSSRVVYRNRWMTVREDEIRRRDRSPGIYGVCEKPEFAVVIPVEADGSIHLVEQYRYPIGQRFWEFPQGAWEDRPDADPAEVAAGELREETGLIAGRLEYAGHFWGSYGFAHQGGHVFVARDLSPSPFELHPEEQGMISRCFTFATVLAMIRSGAIKDVTSIGALALAQLHGLVRYSSGS